MIMKSSEQKVVARYEIPGDWNFEFGSVAPTLYLFLRKNPIKKLRVAGNNIFFLLILNASGKIFAIKVHLCTR